MIHFFSQKGERFEAHEKDIAEGGQASVYFPVSHPGSVMKIYKKQPSREEIEKLSFMIANPPTDPCRVDGHISYAWPSALVFDQAARVAGYLMPRVQKSASVLDVFNPRRRKLLKLDLDWRFLHGVAANLASVIASLHEKRYIIGDINEGNVLVNNRALVTLIDVDSFQVDTGSRLFPCPVGKEEYTPREVLARGFSGRREACSDAFGLAVLVYQLLLEGNHPFRGVWKGAGDPPPVSEKIRRGYYPLAPSSPNRPLALLRPTFGDLTPEIQQLFLRAFIDGHGDPNSRPSAADWHRALRSALKEMRECSHATRHFYFAHSPTCPWCRRKSAAPPSVTRISREQPPVAPPARPSMPPAQPRVARATAATAGSGPISLSKTTLDFGLRFAGSARGNWRKLSLTNQGSRAVSIAMLSADAWITFSEERFTLLPGAKKDLRVKLDLATLPSWLGERSGMAFVRTSEGPGLLPVRVKVALQRPDVRFSSMTCRFSPLFRFQKLVQEIRVRNQGQSALSLKLSSKEKWIEFSPPSLKLQPGSADTIRVIVNPSSVKGQASGKIAVKGPGNYRQDIAVSLK